MEQTISDILARCRHGDACAVRLLVRRFSHSAGQLATALLSDQHLAEDAVQNAFLTALARLEQLRAPTAFGAWFRQIVRTESHRILRHRRGETDVRDEIDIGVFNDPAAAAEASELRAVVREAVKRLPPAASKTTEMFYLDERSHAEIADFLEVPTGTVKRRLHDARRRLRELLAGYMGESEPRRRRPPEWHLPL
jgi:RNA polymerase sigma-70 factor (ECF subfamily)